MLRGIPRTGDDLDARRAVLTVAAMWQDARRDDAAHDALRYLYAATSAHLRGRADQRDQVLDAALGHVAFGCLLAAGTMSVAEQLRDVAEARRMRGAVMIDLLYRARKDMSQGPDLPATILSGARAYLAGATEFFTDDELCLLASRQAATAQALTLTLAAALTWRGHDAGQPAVQLVDAVVTGLASRTGCDGPPPG